MAKPKLMTPALKAEYESLWNTMVIRPERLAEVKARAQLIFKNKRRYELVQSYTGVPWRIIGMIHSRENNCNFGGHLHNGDPLTQKDKKGNLIFARTVRVPKGRPALAPANGNFYTWEESARDALTFKRFDSNRDWSIAGTLFFLEGYNGWGYRPTIPRVNTPYLWSYSNHYTKGYYVADGVYKADAVNKQMGCAALLKELGMV